MWAMNDSKASGKKNSKENEYQRAQTKWEKKKNHYLLTLTNLDVWKVDLN